MESVDRLVTEGSTNIYDSLKVAFHEINESFDDKYNVEIYLLTDGESNINPPGDIVDTLRLHIRKLKNAKSLSEKGFYFLIYVYLYMPISPSKLH